MYCNLGRYYSMLNSVELLSSLYLQLFYFPIETSHIKSFIITTVHISPLIYLAILLPFYPVFLTILQYIEQPYKGIFFFQLQWMNQAFEKWQITLTQIKKNCLKIFQRLQVLGTMEATSRYFHRFRSCCQVIIPY